MTGLGRLDYPLGQSSAMFDMNSVTHCMRIVVASVTSVNFDSFEEHKICGFPC